MNMPKTNVIITGASRGIGYEISRYFAGLDNYRVYALSRNRENLECLVKECAGLSNTSELIPVVFDMIDFLNKPESTIQEIFKGLNHIDILINNAGYLVNKPFDQISADEAMQMLKVNFVGPSRLIRELLYMMGRKGQTHVVNISSMGGYQGSIKFPGLSYYSASKAALANITECLSTEYKNLKITFNCLALGAIQTEMLEEAFPGFNAPLMPREIAGFIGDFAINGYRYINGKIIPVSLSNP